jgi:hypothetical protein
MIVVMILFDLIILPDILLAVFLAVFPLLKALSRVAFVAPSYYIVLGDDV